MRAVTIRVDCERRSEFDDIAGCIAGISRHGALRKCASN
jgi:hypothetical protein